MRGQKNYRELTGRGMHATTLHKGRNSKLVDERNNCLLARYYFYCHHKNKCYEDVLRLIVAEFFISEHTIANIITDHTDDLLGYKKSNVTAQDFQGRWPHIRWQ